MTLRAVTPRDLDAVAELDADLFGPEAWSRPMHREEITHPWRRYLALLHGETLIGWGGVLLGETAEILTIGVARAWQRRGLGAALLAALLDQAQEAGAREVFLEVRSDDDGARRLYEDAGFEGIGIRPNYYQASGKDALVMRREV